MQLLGFYVQNVMQGLLGGLAQHMLSKSDLSCTVCLLTAIYLRKTKGISLQLREVVLDLEGHHFHHPLHIKYFSICNQF